MTASVHPTNNLSIHSSSSMSTEEALLKSEARFKAAIEAVQGILWTNSAAGEMEGEQPGWSSLTGQTPSDYQGFGWTSAIHPDDAQPTVDAWNEAVRNRQTFVFEHRVRLKQGHYELFSVRAVPVLANDGDISEWVGVHTNINAQVQAKQRAEQSQQQLLTLFEQSPVAIAIVEGDDLTFRMVNSFYRELVDRCPDELIDKPLFDAIPEAQGQGFDTILREVMRTGTPSFATEAAAQLSRNGVLETIYIDFAFQPQRDSASGQVTGVFVIATDVTQQVRSRKRVEDSEDRFRSLIEQAPVATGLYVGPNRIIEVANDSILGYWGKDKGVIGLPLIEALPELEGQPFMDLLEQVYTSGEPYHEKSARADLVVDGNLQTFFFDYTYKPIRNAQGEIYAVLNMAVDVTEEVHSRRRLEEAQATLRGAVELAGLATWRLDIEQGTIRYSDRFMNWLGFSENTKVLDDAYNPLPDSHRQSVADALEAAWQAGSNGFYENEHPIINRLTGQMRIIHARAEVQYDSDGKPVFLNGTARDVTQERQQQQELERQVGERTAQLQELVYDLERSNQNLQQFAYVASHDLQEPLRKIQSFGDLLKTRHGEELGEGLDYLNRMQVAAKRMSALIKDLLTYSRISTRQEISAPLSLDAVIRHTLTDLELAITDTKAVVDVAPLTTILGDCSQLGQLFQNLISNALKFRRQHPDGTFEPPHIRIGVHRVLSQDLPPTIRPARIVQAYQRIDVSDNGIGFDQKYADRIFQVFQRLHGKSEFDGTGIGLAICEKVAANHGGAITATSEPGQGATFSLYLPE